MQEAIKKKKKNWGGGSKGFLFFIDFFGAAADQSSMSLFELCGCYVAGIEAVQASILQLV